MNIVIIGGGISGLATGFFLMEKQTEGKIQSLDIKIIDADERPGGKIWSEKTDGFLCESGPNGFLDNKPLTLELCDKLDISKSLLRTNDSAKKRFIYTKGRLHQLPESPLSFFFGSKILSFQGKLRILLEPFTKLPEEGIDETIADFVKRHIGDEALRELVSPMVSGVFAGDSYSLSLKSSFPVMAELEKEGNGSLVKAMVKRISKGVIGKRQRDKRGGPLVPGGTLTSFKEGIEYLTQILSERLGARIISNTEVQRIEKMQREYHPYTIYFKYKKGEGKFDADAIILATPAYITAKVIGSLEQVVSNTLKEIPYSPVAVVCIGYRRSLISHPLDGFGFLIPHEERMNILGCLWDSSMYESRAPDGYVLLRVMIGGARKPESAFLKDDDLLMAVRNDLKIILGIDVVPDFVRIYRHEKAIPQYTAGHSERMKIIEDSLNHHPGLFLTGNSYYGIGINDCVREAFKTSAKVLEYCSRYKAQGYA
jgi:oxygen-dependent protoporphyrinogen oxidase